MHIYTRTKHIYARTKPELNSSLWNTVLKAITYSGPMQRSNNSEIFHKNTIFKV